VVGLGPFTNPVRHPPEVLVPNLHRMGKRQSRWCHNAGGFAVRNLARAIGEAALTSLHDGAPLPALVHRGNAGHNNTMRETLLCRDRQRGAEVGLRLFRRRGWAEIGGEVADER
jgi:hypothetical protein